MRFISGLKKLFKKPLLTIILFLFILSWFLVILGITLFTIPFFKNFVQIFSGIFAGFIFVLMIFSFFKPIDNMGPITIIIAILLTIPVIIIFTGIIFLFFLFCFFANLFLIALFAYKWCIDNSIKLDNYLYKKKGSRKITRTLEFFIFLIITFFLLSSTIIYTKNVLNNDIVANIFLFIALIDLILLVFVILRLLFVQKISAYISLFFVFSYFYILYVIINLWYTFIYGGSVSPNLIYEFISFAIDLIMFIYIIGSIFDRVDYLKEKLHILRADTIALFVILMKILVKNLEIQFQINPTYLIGFEVFQAIIVLIYFTFFAFIFGLYSIIFRKEGEK